MPPAGARPVPGPRREGVAQLACVSVDYHVRLERGRHFAPRCAKPLHHLVAGDLSLRLCPVTGSCEE